MASKNTQFPAIHDDEVRRIVQVYENYRQTGTESLWHRQVLANELMIDERTKATDSILKKAGMTDLSQLDILEIGCGSGGNLAALLRMGADPARLHGIDLLEKEVESARVNLPGIDVRCADARSFTLGTDTVDLLVLHTVLSSVLDKEAAQAIANRGREMLRPGGSVLWYDFFIKNPRNPHTRAMQRRDIEELFPGFELDLQRITVLPPLARRLGRMASFLYPKLARIPLLQGHYLGLLTLPAAAR